MHEAACPEISPPLCAEVDVPVHQHDQRIAWGRLHPALHVGLGGGWQLGLSLPFDLRVLRVDYLTLDGAPYVPPYGDIHHRDEVLAGLVDGRLQAWRYARAGRWVLGAGVGSTVPLGRTEDDPFARTALGLAHQHFQLGSGTFDPLVGLQAVIGGTRWGAWAALNARLPLYANGRGYRPPTAVDLSLGPTLRLSPKLQLMATGEAIYETPERWSGAPYGGRVAAVGGLTGLVTLSPSVVLQAQARYTAWEAALAREDEPLRQGLVLTAGASWTFGRRDDPASGGASDEPGGDEGA